MSIIKHLQAALQFLTSLPLGRTQDFEAHKIIPYFPVVGIVIGSLTAGFDLAIRGLWPVPIVSFLDLTLMVVLTGALHLDGLADSADGLLSHRSKERMLSIMKDSRVGVMGVVCLVCILGIKWCGISSIESQRTLILILIPAYARATSLIGFASLPYGRPEGGLGQPFFQESKPVTSFWAFAVLIPISLFLGWKALVLNILFVFLVFSFLFFIHKRLGCLTGDIFGAMIETTEALLFLGMSLIV